MAKLRKWIGNLKVSAKLQVYRMAVLVMIAFFVLVALVSTLVIRSTIHSITEVWSPSLECLQELQTITAKYRIKQYQHLVETDTAAMAACEKETNDMENQIKDISSKLEKIINSNKKAQAGKADYEKASSAWEDYMSASDKIYKLSREGKQADAANLMTGSVYESNKEFVEKLNSARDDFQAELDTAKVIANICTIIIFIVIIITGLAIAVIATIIGKIISDSITEPVRQIDEAVASLRKGDLTRNGDDITPFLGDFSELKDSLLYILKRFNSTLSEISSIAEQVTHNAKEVESASKSLADGATEQAGVIQELNATIDTVVDLAVDTASETKNASERVKASANKANEEKEKMNVLLTEMEHITDISKEIGNIITDIEDIASQTNLLALNASIEAARAGEAGKGFAVVADQIGKLAADSANSAVNTRELIDKTLVEIQKGNEITITTAEAFNQIISDMNSFAEMAQNTMEKANTQAESLEQIGQGIEQLSGVVQGTAASSEENTAISINLAEGADKMNERVNRFKLF